MRGEFGETNCGSAERKSVHLDMRSPRIRPIPFTNPKLANASSMQSFLGMSGSKDPDTVVKESANQ